MAEAVKSENDYRVVPDKEKEIKNPKVIIIKKPQLNHWYDKKIELWQALLMSGVLGVIGYVGGQIR